MQSLDPYQCLVLNADYRPLSYAPLSLWNWQEAVQAAYAERVDVVAAYDRRVRSPSLTLALPSVVALKSYVPLAPRPPFNRRNLFLRDGFRCQYCGRICRSEELTFDHVVPRSRGGRATWENVVAACVPCNIAKGNRTQAECGLVPRQPPRTPSARELYEAGRRFPSRAAHASWRDFLYWTVELEPA